MENRDSPGANPYAAPAARVADPSAAAHPGNFSPDGDRVPAGHGMRWIVEGFGIFRAQPLVWVGVSLGFLVLTFAAQLIPILGWLAGGILGPVWIAGVMIGCQDIMAGNRLRFSHLFAGFNANGGRLMLFGLVNLLMIVLTSALGVALSYRILGGGFSGDSLPSIAGIVFMAAVMLGFATPYLMLIWFGPPLIALSDQPVGAALRGSFFGCAKNWVPFLIYGLVLGVIALVVMVGVGAALGAVMGAAGFTMMGLVRGGTGGAMAGMGLGLLVTLLLSSLVLPLFFASLYASFRDIYYRPE